MTIERVWAKRSDLAPSDRIGEKYRGARERRDRDERVIDAYEAMQLRRKGRLDVAWPDSDAEEE